MPTSLTPLQEYEHRFQVWLDNLEYVVEYNAKHITHWVRLQFHSFPPRHCCCRT